MLSEMQSRMQSQESSIDPSYVSLKIIHGDRWKEEESEHIIFSSKEATGKFRYERLELGSKIARYGRVQIWKPKKFRFSKHLGLE